MGFQAAFGCCLADTGAVISPSWCLRQGVHRALLTCVGVPTEPSPWAAPAPLLFSLKLPP